MSAEKTPFARKYEDNKKIRKHCARANRTIEVFSFRDKVFFYSFHSVSRWFSLKFPATAFPMESANPLNKSANMYIIKAVISLPCKITYLYYIWLFRLETSTITPFMKCKNISLSIKRSIRMCGYSYIYIYLLWFIY